MRCLAYQHRILHCEAVDLVGIAKQFETPCYVYSKRQLQENFHAFAQPLSAIKHRVCYAVKANPNLGILKHLKDWGAGFDIVSSGELARVLAVGADPSKIVYSGVGKTDIEIVTALQQGIGCFNVESEPELAKINSLAQQLNKVATIALRVNPNIDAHTHKHITTGNQDNKFGIPSARIVTLCQQMMQAPALRLQGLAMHIGSQITQLAPFHAALDHIVDLYQQLQQAGIAIQTLDIGGGLGIRYHDEHPPTIREFLTTVASKLQHLPVEIILEPGRAIVGNAGSLLTRVLYLKKGQQKSFAIVDAGMNDYIRPALYDAYQTILPVNETRTSAEALYDIVGPVCESADYLAKDRRLSLAPGDLLAICDVGAYGSSMASNYNSRPRPAEVLVDGSDVFLIRQRETNEMLYALETFS